MRKPVLTFLSIWLASNVAFSNGVVAPELPLLAEARKAAEFPVLRRLQELTLDLQLLEITVKNRRDQDTEGQIATALREIENEGARRGELFAALRAEQLTTLYSFFALGRRYGAALGVADAEWNELFEAVRSGAVSSGTLAVHGRIGTLNLITLLPLHLGRQLVWKLALPPLDSRNFWLAARRKVQKEGIARLAPINRAALSLRLDELNAPFAAAEASAREFYLASHRRLYASFERHRYAIMQRVELARKALAELGRSNSAMGTPEEYSALYNKLLENLFSYGIDMSLAGGEQRDMAIKGFLFADTPEAAEALLRKLRYTESPATYNSPSS
jgi:hypothetical protein